MSEAPNPCIKNPSSSSQSQESAIELEELTERLARFCVAHYQRDDLRVHDVVKMPGHAGFAYGFRVLVDARVDSWFLRLPPPNVNWVGTADVMRQVVTLNALTGTEVPHCRVQWSGNDLVWFGRPYFVVPWLDGDVVRLGDNDWTTQLSPERKLQLAGQFLSALAGIHKIDPRQVDYLGTAVSLTDDVVRWDRLYERAAEGQRLSKVPVVRSKLLQQLPQVRSMGLFHGDFHVGNLFCSPERVKLLAVIDWELCGIGATQNDVGWMATFSDAEAWSLRDGDGPGSRNMFLDPETLIDLYQVHSGERLLEMNWFRALAAYKFAIITGFNLDLHRRGKREDPMWEEIGESMEPLIRRAEDLLI